MTTATNPILWRLRIVLGQAVVVLGALAIIQGLVQSGRLSHLFVSAPTDVATAFAGSFVGDVLPAALVTLVEITVALTMAALVGMTGGYLLWRHRDLGQAYEVLLNALFGSPTVLLYPIALVFFGREPRAIIAMAAAIGVIPIALNTRQALLQVNPVLIRLGRSLRLSDAQIFRSILLPAAAPGVFAGLQIGLSYMFKVALAMEFIVQIGGLGRLVGHAFDLMNTKQIYVGIVAVVLGAVIFVSILTRIEHGLRRAR